MEQKLYIENKIEALPLLTQKLEAIGDEWQLPMPIVMNLNLVLEEAVTNIIFYAYTDKKKHQIGITLQKIDNQLIVIITDDGIAFDPTQNKSPDTTLSVEERKVGGLGIFLIQKIMDSVEYQRKNNTNTLTLKKTI